MTTNETSPSRSKRAWSLRATAGALAVLTAVPAAAAVVIQNFVKTDVAVAAACMTKIAGGDATDFNTSGEAPYFNVNTTATAATADSVLLLNETVTLQGFAGDRVITTDTMRIKNTCNYDLVVSLKVEDQPFSGATATSGTWTRLAVKGYLAADDVAVLQNTDFGSVDWNADFIHVNSAGVADASSGTVTIAPGEEFQVGFQIDAGSAAATDAATMRFTVSGAPVPGT